MKKQMLALALAGLLMLSGCTSMLERSHVSSTAHVDYSIVTEDASLLRVETYQGLVNSILYFVNERADTGTIRLYNYTGDVETDLANACSELLQKDPLCAYSVQSVNYDSTRILTYYEIALSFDYARTAEEVAAIREVIGLSGLRQELAQMVAGQETKLTLLTSYFSGSAETVEQLLMLAHFNDPAQYHDPGGTFRCEVVMYPETGSRRVIEVTVNRWGTADETELASYTSQLEETAALLLEANPPAGAAYTAEELAGIVRSASGPYDLHGSHLPLEVLSGAAAADTGLLLAMEYLCLQSGLDATMVWGGDQLWLIVSTEDGYRHLLPQSLYPLVDEEGNLIEGAEAQPLSLYTDEELLALGAYSWNSTLYPSCVSRTAGSEE